jgi:acyl-CoA synthetase (AMP-forming)/AMP-acid ligase II
MRAIDSFDRVRDLVPDRARFVDTETGERVVTGGFSVFSAEVEAAIAELPQVAECAVIGVPHAKWGEAVHAVVVSRCIDAGTIIAHVKARLGGVKAPKAVEFVESIPRNAAGKVDRKLLRARHWDGRDPMVN